MKLPIILTALIIVGASFWGIRGKRELITLREEHRRAIRETASLGISKDTTKPFVPTKRGTRPREDKAPMARDLAAEMADFAREMKEIKASGKGLDEAMRNRMLEMAKRLAAMNRSELNTLIAEIRNSTDIDDTMRKGMIEDSIMILAWNKPQAALALYTESFDMLKDNPIGSDVVSSALGQLAKDHPLDAIEWIKTHSGKHQDLVTDKVKASVFAGAARTDFGLAFQLAGELNVTPSDATLLDTLARAANTPEKRSELLGVIRKQAALLADKDAAGALLKSGTDLLSYRMSKDGFDKSVAWIDSANLAPEERGAVVGSLQYHQTREDTGRWLDWISSQPSNDDTTGETTRKLVRDWTNNDYKAAGEWLANSPAGPMKNEAVVSYVQTVAPYDTDVAVQWAETLSPDQRAKAIHGIHSSLRQKDEAAAAEFAKRHGIGEE